MCSPTTSAPKQQQQQHNNNNQSEIKQSEKINMDAVFARVKGEMEKRVQMLTTQELHERNLIRAINSRVILW